MLRSTYAYWTVRCPHCGYCSSDISELDEYAAQVIQSDDYQTKLHDKSFPELANTFICESMILLAGGHSVAAGFSYVHAAWACDDESMNDQASKCRLNAVAIFEAIRAKGQHILDDPAADAILLGDLLRRSRVFDFSIGACDQGLARGPEEVILKILRFQKHLCFVMDSGLHTIEEAIKWSDAEHEREMI